MYCCVKKQEHNKWFKQWINDPKLYITQQDACTSMILNDSHGNYLNQAEILLQL